MLSDLGVFKHDLKIFIFPVNIQTSFEVFKLLFTCQIYAEAKMIRFDKSYWQMVCFFLISLVIISNCQV